MTVTITLTVSGADTGPFNLYSNLDLITPFEFNVDRLDLISGYTTALVPDGTEFIRIQSTGICTNYVDVNIAVITTTSTTTIPISTTSTTSTTTTCADAVMVTNNITNPITGVQSITFTVSNGTGVDELLGLIVTSAGSHGLIYELFKADHTTNLESGILSLDGEQVDMDLLMEGSTSKQFILDIIAKPNLGGGVPNCVSGDIYCFNCSHTAINPSQTEAFAVCDTTTP